jgi:hypothetical protein
MFYGVYDHTMYCNKFNFGQKLHFRLEIVTLLFTSLD